MQDLDEKYLESLSDEELDKLYAAYKQVRTQRICNKDYERIDFYRELYNGSWLKLKHEFAEENFESQFVLVHIVDVQNVYNMSEQKDNIIIDVKYDIQYQIDMFDENDVELRSIKTIDGDASIVTFNSDELIEVVDSKQVENIVDSVISKLKR